MTLKRLSLLLETQRIVNNNLPFCFGEYHESQVIKEVCTRSEFQATLNSRTVVHAIVELYSAGRCEVIVFFARQPHRWRSLLFPLLQISGLQRYKEKNILVFACTSLMLSSNSSRFC
ncbi:hypothetical protein V7S43_004472 [Phytophthora oleae]|uniref:Uncharacterized protein n=1 Tax=Phytophthora oleae TaxID=2107226 RepID=A0ABD3FT96_9STRA